MIAVEKIRKDFPMLQGKTMQNKPLIYLDNGATTLKPKCVIDAVCDYLSNYSGNAHRGDYDISYEVDTVYEATRQKVADFINCDKNEIVYTSGTTDSMNMIAFGYVRNILQPGDEILLTVAEHASNILPWFEVVKQTGAIIKYIPLDNEGKLHIDAVKETITKNTKVISVAQVTNVVGFEAPIKEICKLAHSQDIIVCVDGAQSTPHQAVDMQDLDADFFAFSGHKMCGPTGIGILYGKYELLQAMEPIRLGGGNNARFSSDGKVSLKNAPAKFEAGTQNIEGVIGLGKAVDYLQAIGMENIHNYEKELRAYAISKMKEIDTLEIYNENATGPITFNIKGVFSQDSASLFNKYGIAVRSGQHCAKILSDFLHVNQTLRISLYFYNTKQEIDTFIDVCKKGDEFLDAFFG